MRQLARRAQGAVIDFLEQRLGWDVVEAQVAEDESYHDSSRVLVLSITAEYQLDDDENEYRHDPGEEAQR